MRTQLHDPAEPAASLTGLPEPELLRVLGALTETFVADTYHAATIERLQAQIEPLAFERLFADKEDCFLQIFEYLVAEGQKSIVVSAAIEDTWPRQLAAGLWALLTLMDAQPFAARLVLIESQAATPEIFGRFFDTIRSIAPFMREGRLAAEERMPVLADTFLPSGIASVLAEHLNTGREAPLSSLYDALLQMQLSYYSDSPDVSDFLALETTGKPA